MAASARNVLQAAVCLIGLVVAWRYLRALDGSEFSAGRVTGPLLILHFGGAVSFAAALVFTFIRLGIAAVVGLVASLICLPTYFYFVAPGVFRLIFPGDYSVPLASNFVWEGWAAAGIMTVPVMAVVVRSRLSGARRPL